MRHLVATLALAGLLMGCAGTNFSYDQARRVQVGMSEQQVVQIMGKPYAVTARGDEQLWVWSRGNGFTGSSRAVSFILKDGAVVQVPSIPASFR